MNLISLKIAMNSSNIMRKRIGVISIKLPAVYSTYNQNRCRCYLNKLYLVLHRLFGDIPMIEHT